jgi:hypothetical protein
MTARLRRGTRRTPRRRPLGSGSEAGEHLVVSAVFKTDGPEHLGPAGSIPVRLRHLNHLAFQCEPPRRASPNLRRSPSSLTSVYLFLAGHINVLV